MSSLLRRERASLLVLHHHEHYDGTGYPAGLVGEEAPLGSRIVSVVDAFDATEIVFHITLVLPFHEFLAFRESNARARFGEHRIEFILYC